MERKDTPGIGTTEFWFSVFGALGALVAPFVTLLVLRGVVAGTEAELWVTLGTGLLQIAGMIVAGFLVQNYTKQRTALKK